MTGWLLDTNILSLFAPTKDVERRLETRFAEWIVPRSDSLFVSAISIAEIQAGIAKMRRSGALRRSDDYRAWLALVMETYGSRVLAFDADMGLIAGDIVDRAVATGRHPGISDILIAATAERYGLTILTNNIRHFEPLKLGVALVDPLREISESES